VKRNFTQAGIMVHAYLMYGFPTQTAQETIDSLEMVRQLFKAGILQSAYWHQFAMTAHSPVGLHPELFHVEKETNETGTFANNDIVHIDPTGADHESFSFGLKKSLFNYMHGLGLDDPLQKWFEEKVPKTKVAPDFIIKAVEEEEYISHKPAAKIVWLGNAVSTSYFTQSKKGNTREMASLSFITKKETTQIQVPKAQGDWLAATLQQININNPKTFTLKEITDSYEAAGLEDFELFWDNKPVNSLWKVGVLLL
jgi:hypothetical protein